jgi:hypothetical protein
MYGVNSNYISVMRNALRWNVFEHVYDYFALKAFWAGLILPKLAQSHETASNRRQIWRNLSFNFTIY